jgi:Type II secretion system (T2SS), protein G
MAAAWDRYFVMPREAMRYRYRLRYRLSTMLITLVLGIIVFMPLIKRVVRRWRPRPPSSQWVAYFQLVKFDAAIKDYFIDVGELPSSIDDLLSRPSELPATTKWAGPYLDENAERLDPWNKPINYEITDRLERKYRIWSNGPDRLPWTRDDVTYRY